MIVHLDKLFWLLLGLSVVLLRLTKNQDIPVDAKPFLLKENPKSKHGDPEHWGKKHHLELSPVSGRQIHP